MINKHTKSITHLEEYKKYRSFNELTWADQKKKHHHRVCGFSWREQELTQFPRYDSDAKLWDAEIKLQKSDLIVEEHEVRKLSHQMERVPTLNGFVIQVGDCAETFHHSNIVYTTQRLSLFNELHQIIQKFIDAPVLTMGRMAGQFAKPRSSMTETIDGQIVSSYFGDVVNGFDHSDRTPDPKRLLIGHTVARDTTISARTFCHVWSALDKKKPFIFGEDFFVCHEAYLLPYEQNLVRPICQVSHYTKDDELSKKSNNQSNQYFSSSGHFLWVGERTRNIEHGHIQFVKNLQNPIGVKIGPSAEPAELIDLINILNPNRIPGRLSFIVRLGKRNIHLLHEYAYFLKNANRHRDILWICDPMHGNTIQTQIGKKTRRISDILFEIDMFFKILSGLDIPVSGVHLEATPHDVYECQSPVLKIAQNLENPFKNQKKGYENTIIHLLETLKACSHNEEFNKQLSYSENEMALSNHHPYLSTCDPRLNSQQVIYVLHHLKSVLKTYRSFYAKN